MNGGMSWSLFFSSLFFFLFLSHHDETFNFHLHSPGEITLNLRLAQVQRDNQLAQRDDPLAIPGVNDCIMGHRGRASSLAHRFPRPIPP